MGEYLLTKKPKGNQVNFEDKVTDKCAGPSVASTPSTWELEDRFAEEQREADSRQQVATSK